MKQNEGSVDRAVRVLVGIVLLSLVFVGPHTWFGLVGLVPLVTGRFPLFFGFDPKMLGSVLLILAGFGAAMGWLYGLFESRA